MEIQFTSMTLQLHMIAFWTLIIHPGGSTRKILGVSTEFWGPHPSPPMAPHTGYNSAINGCERSTRRWATASKIFESIEEELLQMNVVSYNSLISCYSQEGSTKGRFNMV